MSQDKKAKEFIIPIEFLTDGYQEQSWKAKAHFAHAVLVYPTSPVVGVFDEKAVRREAESCTLYLHEGVMRHPASFIDGAKFQSIQQKQIKDLSATELLENPLVREFKHHIEGLIHDCKRYDEAGKEKMDIVKMLPALNAAMAPFTGKAEV